MANKGNQMNNIQEISHFLESNNFHLVSHIGDLSFGDYYDIYSNGNINIKFITDRSKDYRFICIHDVHVQDVENLNWFDIGLIKDFLNNEKNLDHGITFDESLCYLKGNFSKISYLFNKKNIFETLKKLDDLQIERAKQMFPQLY